MKRAFNNTLSTLSHYKIAILWAVFFTANSLGSVIMASLVNVEWTNLNAQDKFLIYVAIIANWSGTMMAYLSRVMHRLTEEVNPLIEDPPTPTNAKANAAALPKEPVV